MRLADVLLYAAIGLVLAGVAVAMWIGKRQPKFPIPRQAIYVLIWLGVAGLLAAYFSLRSHS